MFHKAQNTQIHNGQFTVVDGDVNTQINAQKVVIKRYDSRKRQRQLSSDSDDTNISDMEIDDPPMSKSKSKRPHAKRSRMDNEKLLSKLHAAKDAGRVGSKACLDGTRVALLARITAWALNPTGERVLLLNGAAGMGKSAIAHTIAKHFEKSGEAIVSFFAFNRSVQERSSSQLIPTWVKYLAEKNGDYCSYLHGLTNDELGTVDLVDQCDMLLMQGLSSLSILIL
ncbi:hypothetical protein H0H92_003727 [Tricholoma furcatifolium]|nr:hypothetical protein H0H92_003727 [Tricholoma furcatifolium]